MTESYLYLIPISLLLGGIGLLAFFWCLSSSQYDDLKGAAERILLDDLEEQDSDQIDQLRRD